MCFLSNEDSICKHCSEEMDIIRLFFLYNLRGGTLGTAATTCLLYHPRMKGDGDYGEKTGGMKIVRGNRSTRRKPAPAPLVHHKSHMTRPGFEPGPPRWEASDYFFLNQRVGTLGTAATTGLLYQPQMICDGDCVGIGGIKIGRGNRSTRREPVPAPLRPPQIPHN
jgi:hypothetical protein